MVTVFFYLHIFTGSVGRRILIVVPVDTLYRTSVISYSTVLLLNPFANLSLAPLSLFSIYGPDLGVWVDCWVSAEFLRAPIPRKGSGSTTTTTYDKQCKKFILPQDSNLHSLDYRSTALPLELETMSPRMLNFGYLNVATCFYYDVDDNLIVMF